MKKVNVLLSTFNGMQFLKQQLDSIANQDYESIEVSIRDDGSTDGTYNFCREYVKKKKGWDVTVGKNIGVFQSFMQLLLNADPKAEYYAFCDQDDMWFTDKISRAVKAFEKKEKPEIPTLYCTRVLIADKNLDNVKVSRMPKHISLHSALVENVAQGSTIVLNQTARNVLIKNIPEKLPIHDWWCYLLIAAMGEIIFDPNPSMIYRKHLLNVSYGAFGGYRKIAGRLRRFLDKDDVVIFRQAELLLRLYNENLPADALRIVNELVNIKASSIIERLKLFVNNPFHRQSFFDDIILRVYFLMI